MHTARSEPLGPHSAGLLHVLRARGDGQLLNREGFSLWRIAHHRLQARQILLREQPFREQRVWIDALATEQPDLHIITHVFRISILCGQADLILSTPSFDDPQQIEAASRLRYEIWNAVADGRVWQEGIPQQWLTPKSSFDSPIDPLKPVTMASMYHDIWVAYMWNYYHASLIALHEVHLDLLSALLQAGMETNDHLNQAIEFSHLRIHELARILLETMPQLLGLLECEEASTSPTYRQFLQRRCGKGLGGFFAMYGILVIRASKYVLPEQKQVVEGLLGWIRCQNSIF